MIKSKYIPEYLFVIYFWGFVFIKPILQNYPQNSTTILLLFSIIIAITFIIYALYNNDLGIRKSAALISIMFIIFMIDATVRNNPTSFEYLSNFAYRALLPVFILSKVRDTQVLLRAFVYMSILAFILFGADPLRGYPIFGEYMNYGFMLALPAFLGIFLGFHYFKIKWMITLEVIALIAIVIFSNRSILMNALLFIILYYHKYGSRLIKTQLVTISALFAFSILFGNVFNSVLYDVLILLADKGYSSYSLSKMLMFQDGIQLFATESARIQIWNEAYALIKQSPVFGYGMGMFKSQYGYYSHNIILDLFLYYGIVGFVSIVTMIIISSRKILLASGENYALGIMFFALWFPKLMFSSYFIMDFGFWCFLAYGFMPITLHRCKI